MTYTADQFGIYLALAVHGGTQVDFLDEDALLNSTVMADYKSCVCDAAEPSKGRNPTVGSVGQNRWQAGSIRWRCYGR